MRKNALRIVLVTVVVVLCHCNYLNAQGWSYPTEQIQDLPYEDGMGTEEAPYRITNAQQLANLSYYVNNGVGYEGIYFALAADIDLNPGYTFGKDGTISGGDAPQQWVPIGTYTGYNDKDFKGSLDGQGHTIRGIYLTFQQDCEGLFGVIKNGNVRNLTISNSLIINNNKENIEGYCAGLFAGYALDVNFVNCRNESSIYGRSDNCEGCVIGGIAGIFYAGDKATVFKDCHNSGNISAIEVENGYNPYHIYTGGIIGRVMGGFGNIHEMYRCTNSGDISSTGMSGGLAGAIDGFYACSNLDNTGTISGELYVGGIFGQGGHYSDGKLLEACTNTGRVFSNFALAIGGIIGDGGYAEIINCANKGEIEVTGKRSDNRCYTGGIIGNPYYNTGNAPVINLTGCYNLGNITIDDGHCGGLIGQCPTYSKCKMEKCYNAGMIANRKGTAGGLTSEIWKDGSSIINCYNTGDVSGNIRSTGGLVGVCCSASDIIYCYTTGSVTPIDDFMGPEVGGCGSVIGCVTQINSIHHCYYLSSEDMPAIGVDYAHIPDSSLMEKTADDFAGGQVCILLNDTQDPTPWGQEPGKDPTPLLNGKGNPEVSGIETIEQGEYKGETVIYDLTGRKVESTKGLKGIYIVNGKKVLFTGVMP